MGTERPPVVRSGSFLSFTNYGNQALSRQDTANTIRTIGPLKLRALHDDLPQAWWFASTAIPLLCSTIGPLSNVLSVASLASPWRVTLPNNGQLPEGADMFGVGIADPRWEIICNAISLACGLAGNIFLLLNFTGRVRYIVSLPLSIIFWILASAILIAITAAMHVYAPARGPGEIYSQGYWHAVLASILYLLSSLMLIVNMLGYFRGHYPQHFDLDDDQRTLILQTMMYFIWLAAGAGVFSKIEGWSYPDALYYSDVSILTIGFGDIYPTTDGGRGFLFVFELVGIIFLGLVISSVSRFVRNISADKIVKAHQNHARESTVGRTVTNEKELRDRLGLPPRRRSADQTVAGRRESLNQYGRLTIEGRTITFHEKKAPAQGGGRGGAARKALSRDEKMRARSQSNNPLEKRQQRRQRLLLLREEKDRFDAMREIQDETKRFKQFYALFMSFLAFGLLWGVGALIFMFSEERLLGLSYFEALYFCFVSLLTIGYGDLSPRSNAGRPFFIVWSLIAVPTMTILIQEMSSTVVSAVNRGTFTLADWTVMPKKGVAKAFLRSHPRLAEWLAQISLQRQEEKRVQKGFGLQDPDEPVPELAADGATSEKGKGLEQLAREDDDHDLARQLAVAIKGVAHDLRAATPKRYSYEEWVHFTKLMRFSTRSKEEVELVEEEEGFVPWDWIGEDSPLLADITEAEWVLNKMCESLSRYTRGQARRAQTSDRSGAPSSRTLPETIKEATDDEEENGGPSSYDAHTREWADKMRRLSPSKDEEDLDGR